MSETITLELPGELAERARAVATQMHRSVEDVLLEWLDRASTETPVDLLPDEQILSLRDMQMSTEQQAELRSLLEQQREGTLDSATRSRLDVLMRAYRQGMVRKAQALKVAVERGLQPPLN
jgi:hypothetical protein